MIAIPDMELPKGCDECPLTDGIRCKARDKDIKEYVLDFFESYHEKPTDCPLIDIVRCGECKHRDPEDKKCDCGMSERQGCIFPVADDYFCKYGEPRGSEYVAKD